MINAILTTFSRIQKVFTKNLVMKYGLTSMLLLFTLLEVTAQKTYLKSSDSDPKAKKILDALKKEYNGYKAMEISFELILELKGQAPETQKGKLIQQGKKYFVSVSDQEVYCDGKTVWLHQKANKEVQINSFEEGPGADMMSPSEMLRMYESGQYAYAITGNATENGTKVTQIEFKPLDKNSEYSKIRLSVAENTNKATSIKVFSKDGSRYTLNVKSIVPNKTYAPEIFVFNAKQHPGVHIEDLRID